MHFSAVVYFTVFAGLIINSSAQPNKSPEQVILEGLFRDGSYDRRVRPVNNEDPAAPVLVNVNMYIRRLDKLDDINSELSLQLTFRQKWKDDRLSYTPTDGVQSISLINPQNEIWRPDTFFSNEIEGKYHDVMVRNEFVRISPKGEVMQSVRISLRLSCPMTLKKLPFDTPTCPIRLASYGHTINNLKYQWDREDPVQISNILTLPTFSVEKITSDYCDSKTNTGSYSCLRVDISFYRDFSSYLINVYIPCTMFVIISWVSFWIDAKAVTGRIILAGINLFVLAIQTAHINDKFPSVAYTKAVDMWTGVCLTFVMASLLEFATVHYVSLHGGFGCSKRPATPANSAAENNDRDGDEEQEIPLKELNKDEEKGNQGPTGGGSAPKITQRASRLAKVYVSKFDSLPEQIDGISRIAFPLTFIIFNIIYWPVYSS